MSTDCRFAADVLIADLFDGRLEHRGITEYTLADTDHKARVLTDGKNYLWVFAQEDGRVVCLTRYGLNWVEEMVESIEQELGIRIYTEYEPQFWGFENQADWDAWHEKTAREHDDWFYGQILRLIAGEPHELVEGTMAMARAMIAKELVSENAILGARENREKLLAAVEEEYARRRPRIAEIAKALVSEDAGLGTPGSRDKLLAAVEKNLTGGSQRIVTCEFGIAETEEERRSEQNAQGSAR